MKSILDEICARSMEDLRPFMTEANFEAMLGRAKVRAPRAPFKDALLGGGKFPAVIAELKKASPSAGLIRGDFDARGLARSLESAGASALSVLTERNYFLGSLDNLSASAGMVKIPLLRKDFIYCEYQICEAAVFGASAVLLIAAMLDAEKFARLYKFAKSLGLDVLAEAHDEFEIAMLLENGADIVGVNCRDLKNFHTDFSVSERLLREIPDGIVRVAESAIADSATLLRARDAGAHAALVGTALMRAPNPGEKLAEILGA